MTYENYLDAMQLQYEISGLRNLLEHLTKSDITIEMDRKEYQIHNYNGRVGEKIKQALTELLSEMQEEFDKL